MIFLPTGEFWGTIAVVSWSARGRENAIGMRQMLRAVLILPIYGTCPGRDPGPVRRKTRDKTSKRPRAFPIPVERKAR
jgi:hypothetical protein